MKFPKAITVVVDAREKTPLLFPARLLWEPAPGYPRIHLKLKTVTKTIQDGDYYLEDWPDVCIFERKASLSELYSNLFTKDRVRAHKAFTRLTEACTHPYLLIERAPAQLNNERCYAGPGGPPPVGIIIDRVCDVVTKFHLSVVWTGRLLTVNARRLTGEYMVRTMLRHAVEKELGI